MVRVMVGVEVPPACEIGLSAPKVKDTKQLHVKDNTKQLHVKLQTVPHMCSLCCLGDLHCQLLLRLAYLTALRGQSRRLTHPAQSRALCFYTKQLHVKYQWLASLARVGAG